MIKFLGWLVGVAFVLLFMKGCKTLEATPFETGDEVPPPLGCVLSEIEERDVDC